MSRLRLAAAGIASLAILGTAAYAQEGQGRRPDAGPSGGAQQAPQQGQQGEQSSTKRAPGVSNQERGPSARGVERGNAERAEQNRRGPSDRGAEKSAAGKERATERRSETGKVERRASDGDKRRGNADANSNSDRKKADTRRSDDRKAGETKRTAEPKARTGDRDRTKAATPADTTTKGDRDRTKSATSPTPTNGKTAGRTGARERIQLTEQQRTTLRDTIIRERPKRVTNVNINIRVGERVPRSVRLRPLPVVLISSYPAYRDYRYVYIRDEICIVDPVTYEIVEVVDTRNGGVRQADLTLSRDQERFVYEAVIDRGPRLNLNLRLGIGAEVPRSVEVQSFPERVVARVPRLANYRFVIDQDQVVVLNPSDYQIAVVISR